MMKKQLMKMGALVCMLAFAACSKPATQIGLDAQKFGTATVDGKEVSLYTLTNPAGMKAQFTNLGAKVVTLYAPDKQGNMADVVLGYATAAEYANCDNGKGIGEPFFGATIGRYGNRIADGKVTIDSVDYQLDKNERVNHLHGGHRGYFSVVWDVAEQDSSKIVFHYLSKDGEMGYPGNLDIYLTYELTNDNSLKISYKATTDKATIVNLTNHSFFNLSGEGSETVLDHELMIAADYITPVNRFLIPTGELLPVAGTAFDFNTQHPVNDSIAASHPQVKLGNGYDHNWVLRRTTADSLELAARLKDPKSGRVMEVYTTEPGVQFYAGNFLNGTQVGKSGKTYPYRSALCLETQHFPDSPHQAQFPSTVLRPGETYSHVCVYKFSAE